MQERSIDVQGKSIFFVEQGEYSQGEPTIVMLHGFPESHMTWQDCLGYLDDNLHVVVPDLPGYGQSAPLAEVTDYKIEKLISRIAAFLSQVSPNKAVVLVAHDWGGAIAWPLAAFYPHLVEKLVIVNAVHPSTFTREMIENPKQREKSAYIHTLIGRDAEHLLVDNDCHYLVETVSKCIVPVPDSLLQAYKANWTTSTTLSAMLEYYRQMPQLFPQSSLYRDDEETRAELAKIKIPNIRIEMPTLVLWGLNDEAFEPGVVDGIEEYVKDVELIVEPNATHWLPRECPQWVSQQIERWLDSE